MSQSFTLRLTARFAVLVTATTALLLVAGGWLLQRQALDGLAELHEIEGGELSAILADGSLGVAELAHRIGEEADSDFALFYVQVRDDRGEIVFRSSNLGVTLLPVLGRGGSGTVELPGGSHVFISEYQSGRWRIQVASRLEPMERLLRDYAKTSGLLLAGAALLSVLFGHRFSRATLQPVRAIEATARRISADNLSERIPASAGHGELTSLIRLLNDTFDRLQQSFDQVHRFTAEASHELKTPLALARLNAEKLQTRVAADPESAGLVAEVLDEITRLNRIIENLLFLARTESGRLSLPMRELVLADLLRDFADDAAALAEDAGMQFMLARNDAGMLTGDAGLLRQLWFNLLSNALAVSEPGGTVILESTLMDDGWMLIVTDDGPGLPPEHLERIFERFTRFAVVPHRAIVGNGLGLAICRRIVELHRGSIRAENRADRKGLRLIIRLPAASC